MIVEFALASLPEILIFTEGHQVILVDVKRNTRIDALLPHLVYKLPSVSQGICIEDSDGWYRIFSNWESC